MTDTERNEDALVEIDGLVVNFYTYQGIVQAIEGVDLVVRRGETLGLVGETGCGKSVTASSIMRLLLSPPGKIEQGSVYFMEPPEVRARRKEAEAQARAWYAGLPEADRRSLTVKFGLRYTGFKKRVKAIPNDKALKTKPLPEAPYRLVAAYMRDRASKTPKSDKTSREALLKEYDLLSKSQSYMQKIRGKFISMIFQEPTSALNPVFTAGDQIAEVILQHRKVEMARRALARMEKESVILNKSRTEWETEAKKWYSGLPEVERRRVIHSTEVSVPFFKGHGVTSEEQTTSALAPDVPPARVLGWYVSRRKRPRKTEEIPDEHAHEKESPKFSCSFCDSKLEPDAPGCEYCGMQHYGRLEWLIRPLVLRTYKTVMQTIIKNPDAKQGIISRVPILRRYRGELEREALSEAIRMLEIVRIPDPEGVATRFPYELSGGMQQRVMIAIALACNPKMLIADEPTTALDVTIQGQILKLMRDLKAQYESSILLITHNLGVVAEMCDRVGVMYAGSIAEIGGAREIFKAPLHPYTMGLMKSVPSIQMSAERLYSIRGSVPNLIYPPNGCRFHPRCDFSRSYCTTVRPPLTEIEPGHAVACHMAAKAEGYVHGK